MTCYTCGNYYCTCSGNAWNYKSAYGRCNHCGGYGGHCDCYNYSTGSLDPSSTGSNMNNEEGDFHQPQELDQPHGHGVDLPNHGYYGCPGCGSNDGCGCDYD